MIRLRAIGTGNSQAISTRHDLKVIISILVQNQLGMDGDGLRTGIIRIKGENFKMINGQTVFTNHSTTYASEGFGALVIVGEVVEYIQDEVSIETFPTTIRNPCG